MDFTDLKTPEVIPAKLSSRVLIVLQQYGATRHHDGLLCQAYHTMYDGWETTGQSPNHWHVSIPKDRSGEASDASIVRGRREVASMVHEPPLSLEAYLKPTWNITAWETYRESVTLESIGRVQSAPQSLREQVAWILSVYPEARDSDKLLILAWNDHFGGWRMGSTTDERINWAIPLSHHWVDTTPESVTDARRTWQQMGVFQASEEVAKERQDKEGRVRQAARYGHSPGEVAQ